MSRGPRGRHDALSSVEEEVISQPDVLESYLRVASPVAPAGSLFVGAGDSYAACCIASWISSARHSAAESYDLLSSPGLAKGRRVYFVSASGMTTSNVEASKAVEGIARERVAITTNPDGKLTDSVDKVIFIPYRAAPRVPGTLSFSLSLLALLKLSAPRVRCDFESVHARAMRDSGRLLISGGGTTHFLGTGAGFHACVYSAMKVYELTGCRAQAWMLEEFGHAGLFSLRRTDAVNVSGAFDPLRHAPRIASSLRKGGFNATLIPPAGERAVGQTFHMIFLAQFAALRKARAAGLTRPFFVGAAAKLRLSDSLIY